MLSNLINNIATGSQNLTPATGSLTVDILTDIPSRAIRTASDLVGSFGS